ncbi:ribbon-helix-helix protein, CopG family [Pseudogracilibacillus sp. SO30301A]|uniref:ribbon-helix-helix protein, CopG family n=1 Tax=Pseudogracilibacillus sp. SO30301A TaxID=3098291 RepID=UPI00300E32F9
MSTKDRTTSTFVMLPGNMVEKINEYKEKNDIRTRNEAIRILINKGLEDSQDPPNP